MVYLRSVPIVDGVLRDCKQSGDGQQPVCLDYITLALAMSLFG